MPRADDDLVALQRTRSKLHEECAAAGVGGPGPATAKGCSSERVKLNVGGSTFETTLGTLTRHPDSMLAAMFSGRHEVPQDDDGCVFLDRDPTHFRSVLNFLRTGLLHVPPSRQAAEELKCELRYYQLPYQLDGGGSSAAEVPAVEMVVTEVPRWTGGFDSSPKPAATELDVDAHTRKVQQRLQANPRLRIVANNVSKGSGGKIDSFDRIITTLATHHGSP